MNITYTNEAKVETKPQIRELPVGTVIECEGTKMLLIKPDNCENVFQNKGLLLLTYSMGDDWFKLKNFIYEDLLENGDFKVLGRIVGLELKRLWN